MSWQSIRDKIKDENIRNVHVVRESGGRSSRTLARVKKTLQGAVEVVLLAGKHEGKRVTVPYKDIALILAPRTKKNGLRTKPFLDSLKQAAEDQEKKLKVEKQKLKVEKQEQEEPQVETTGEEIDEEEPETDEDEDDTTAREHLRWTRGMLLKEGSVVVYANKHRGEALRAAIVVPTIEGRLELRGLLSLEDGKWVTAPSRKAVKKSTLGRGGKIVMVRSSIIEHPPMPDFSVLTAAYDSYCAELAEAREKKQKAESAKVKAESLDLLKDKLSAADLAKIVETLGLKK